MNKSKDLLAGIQDKLCPSEATYLPVVCCFSELAITIKIQLRVLL